MSLIRIARLIRLKQYINALDVLHDSALYGMPFMLLLLVNLWTKRQANLEGT